jgi:hypothetical protein
MPRFVCLPIIALMVLANNVFAESPSPAAGKSAASTAASPAPAEELVNSLPPGDLQTALSLLKSNYTKPDAVNDVEFNRATLQGLLIRQPNGFIIVSDHEPASPDIPVYSEVLEGHIGYVRLGSLTATNLKALDRKLTEFGTKKVDACVVDLRASSQFPADFAVAAEFAKRFCANGKPLFTLRKTATHQDRAFQSDREPAFRGLTVALVDNDTAGGAEALAGALRSDDRALIIGQSSAGRAAEYTDSPLSGGKILRIASSEVVLADGQSLFPAGIKPDLPVQMSLADKRQIFQVSSEKGMSPFIYEAERPHLNEAALLAGTNPELEIPDARHGAAKSKQPARDPVLQRALDVLTSLEIYQKR